MLFFCGSTAVSACHFLVVFALGYLAQIEELLELAAGVGIQFVGVDLVKVGLRLCAEFQRIGVCRLLSGAKRGFFGVYHAGLLGLAGVLGFLGLRVVQYHVYDVVIDGAYHNYTSLSAVDEKIILSYFDRAVC